VTGSTAVDGLYFKHSVGCIFRHYKGSDASEVGRFWCTGANYDWMTFLTPPTTRMDARGTRSEVFRFAG